MAVSIEDILLARAQQDEQGQMSTGTAGSIGATAGGILGMVVGQPVHNAGVLINKMNGRQPNRVKPGVRMAGGLVGAILGGALGAGARESMMSESPAARMLAKIQAQGELSYADQQQLENILADTYSNALGM
jgi:hypothetical protein